MDKESSKLEPRSQYRVPKNRPVGRPKKRWEDEINDFLKPEEIEETKGNEMKNNDTRWKAMETE